MSAQEPGHIRGCLQQRGEDVEIQVVEISNMRVAALLDLQTNRIRRIAKERRLSRYNVAIPYLLPNAQTGLNP